jgi:hypothetical protein
MVVMMVRDAASAALRTSIRVCKLNRLPLSFTA